MNWQLKKNLFSTAPHMGLCRGYEAGRIGVWVNWSESSPLEVFRILVQTSSPDFEKQCPSVSFTFAPAIESPFVCSLEMSYDFREFLVGRERAKHGTVEVEVWCSGTQTLSQKKELDDFLWLYRGHGAIAPDGLLKVPGFVAPDTPEIASISRSELKSFSEKKKQELEERRRKEAAEAKAREEARIAAEKAAKEKAAQEKLKAETAKEAPTDKPQAASGPTLKPAKVGLFYGSSTGNTEEVAQMIKAEFGDSIEYVRNITQIVPQDLTMCETLILGVPTWHIGEMQDDWAAVLPALEKLNFAGKKVAVFGLGDGKGYPDTYVDAMQELLEKFEKTGAKLHGLWPTEGYEFQKSKAIRNGKFLGLVIDVENQDHLSEGRVKAWCTQLRTELGL